MNPHNPFGSADFKSAASASFAIPAASSQSQYRMRHGHSLLWRHGEHFGVGDVIGRGGDIDSRRSGDAEGGDGKRRRFLSASNRDVSRHTGNRRI